MFVKLPNISSSENCCQLTTHWCYIEVCTFSSWHLVFSVTHLISLLTYTLASMLGAKAGFWIMTVLLMVAGLMNEAQVRNECSFTRYPTLCVETLMETSSDLSGEPLDIVSLLVEKTFFATARYFSASLSPSPSAFISDASSGNLVVISCFFMFP